MTKPTLVMTRVRNRLHFTRQ